MERNSRGDLEALRTELEETRKALNASKAEADSRVNAVRKQLREAKAKAKSLIEARVTEAKLENEKLRATLLEKARELNSAKRRLSALEDAAAEADVVRSQLMASKEMLRDMGAKLEADKLLIHDLQDSLKKQESIGEINAQRARESEREKDRLTNKVNQLEHDLEAAERLARLSKDMRQTCSGHENGYIQKESSCSLVAGSDKSVDDSKSKGNLDVPDPSLIESQEPGSAFSGPLKSSDEDEISSRKVSSVNNSQKLAEKLASANARIAELARELRVTRERASETEEGASAMKRCPSRDLTEERPSSGSHPVPAAGGNESETEEGLASLAPASHSKTVDLNKLAGAESASNKSRSFAPTPEGELLRTDHGIMAYPTTTARKATSEAEILADELESIRKERYELENKVGELELQLQTLTAERETLRASNSLERNEGGASAEVPKADLEKKLEGLERSLNDKQQEISKVREKARAYLKELNAEKRDMEKKLKSEMAVLKSTLATQEEKTKAAELRCSYIDKELNGCLDVISEKHKTIQSLGMQLTGEKTLREQAFQKHEELERNFCSYKERAKSVLDERDRLLAEAQSRTETATRELRLQLERAEKEITELRNDVKSVKSRNSEFSAAVERANKAEAALDLLRSESSAVARRETEKSRLLEERMSKLEAELRNARYSAEDAESRNATTLVRLEVAERTLRSSEKQAEEQLKGAGMRVAELRARVKSLEKALGDAREAATSAQRTAAAAAKAMVSNIILPQNGESEIEHANQKKGSPAIDAEISYLRGVDDFVPTSNRTRNVRDETASLVAQVAELSTQVKEAEQEIKARDEQTRLLKSEVRDLESKLVAAERLHNDAPFHYLRNIVVTFLETGDSNLLPVVASVLGLSEEETARITQKSNFSSGKGGSTSGFLSLPFLGGGS